MLVVDDDAFDVRQHVQQDDGMSPFHERTDSHRSAVMDLCQTKYIVLSLLVVQNTVYVLLMRYSRTRPGTMYLSSTAVCCVEAIKMLTCFGILTFAYLFQHRNQDVDGGGEYSMVNMSDSGGAISSSDNGTTDDDDVERSNDMSKSQPINSHASFLSYFSKQLRFDYRLAGIAGIFTIQNNLLFLALTNLEPAVFQVTYQLKVLATAYFSVVLLKKELSRRQIVALVLLAMGVALVELDKTENATNSSHQVQRRWVGILAVLGACCTSGAACVWFEYIVKVGSTEDETSSTRNAAPSLWANQFQMSMFGLIIALIAAIVKDGHAILSGGFFQGYSSVVFLVVTIQAFGGLVVSAVIKYADNILKSYASALSIVSVTVISSWLFDFSISYLFTMGCLLQFISMKLYSSPQK